MLALVSSLRVPTTTHPRFFAAAATASLRPVRLLSSTGAGPISDRGGAVILGADGKTEIHLPPAESPVGLQLYKKAIYCPHSHVLRTSTHVGTDQDNVIVRGRVGVDVDGDDDGDNLIAPEEAKMYAHNAGLRLLATIHDHLDGDMGRVEQVLKLTGMVNASDGFHGHGPVIDGCSEVLVAAFGPDRGVGARVCFGSGSLAGAVSCDVELRVRPPSE